MDYNRSLSSHWIKHQIGKERRRESATPNGLGLFRVVANAVRRHFTGHFILPDTPDFYILLETGTGLALIKLRIGSQESPSLAMVIGRP